ncbi:Coenzyme F420 hydrogenase/dehydrogenase, beta subunit C-terminal domain [Methanolobus sp.]|uniref:Coenzyme F420 hydrogenase/dehydrogenase, beta subunit C-terminal domain n=1 Tax=Methanolobus sp. TaxID=1874737 RepID=UPI0025E0F0EB|nr:Coenzyme F420 hydrogenase/dehydrogenase, beta subunit C-terminal domain [Methanolobus sp.]
MNDYTSINKVVNADLCTNCGTCVSICPKNAVVMEINYMKGTYIPQIDSTLCTDCKMCINVCPGHNVDFKGLNNNIFGNEMEDNLVGNYRNIYVGHSKNSDIRYTSSSGGVITQLLIYALEEGIINGALVTKMDNNHPLEPFPFIARTKKEIIESMGSKYCPVPLNIGLKEILNAPDGQKFAIVGLPCHIHGIKKAEQIHKKLSNKIAFTVGIICSKCPNFLATEYLLGKLQTSKDNIKGISYRGKGYPGGMTLSFIDGTHKFYHYWEYYDTCFGQFFSPTRCRLCIDFTSELSDISCGDVFFDDECKTDQSGSSVIISRNSIGEDLLKKADSQITTRPIDVSKFIEGCRRNIFFRKSCLSQRGKILNKKIPTFNSNPSLKLNFYSYVFLYVYRIGNNISNHKKYWFILKQYGNLIGLLTIIYEKMNSKNKGD